MGKPKLLRVCWSRRRGSVAFSAGSAEPGSALGWSRGRDPAEASALLGVTGSGFADGVLLSLPGFAVGPWGGGAGLGLLLCEPGSKCCSPGTERVGNCSRGLPKGGGTRLGLGGVWMGFGRGLDGFRCSLDGFRCRLDGVWMDLGTVWMGFGWVPWMVPVSCPPQLWQRDFGTGWTPLAVTEQSKSRD